MLRSQRYDRAKALCVGIPNKIVKGTQGMNAFVKAVYKLDPLSAVTAIIGDLPELLQLRRAEAESFKYFELCFPTTRAKFSGNGESICVPESLIVLMILA